MASKFSSIDNSPTKQKYSFPKAARFPKIGLYGAMSFYNLPNLRSERTTTFGYGSRYDFTPKKSENTPACYDYNYGVESNQPSSPKYSFGLGRENMKDNYIDKLIPGPGKYYSPLKSIGKDCPKYSLKGKYNDKNFGRTDSPGPAAYDPKTKINLKGVFGIAGYKNVKSYDFSKGQLDRFYQKVDSTPGPSEYKNDMSMIGNIYDSRFKSTHGIHMVFRHETKERDNYPGPGAYERYGDFYKYNISSIDYGIFNKKSSRKDIYKTPEKKKKNDESNEDNENKEDEDANKEKDGIKEQKEEEDFQ